MTLEQTINDCERLADQQEAIIKNIKNNLAGTPIKEYIDECSECSAYSKQIAEWLKELKEAKRLLKLAVENMNDGGCTRNCSTCKYKRDGCKYTEGYEWVHTEEAAKLLKED